MKYTFLLISALFFFKIMYAQRVHIEPSLLLLAPLGKEIDQNYGGTLGAKLEINAALLKKRLRIGPAAMFTYFNNHYPISTIQTLNMTSAGVGAGYVVYQKDKIALVPCFKWYRTSTSCVISPAKDYQGPRETFLSGKGNTWSYGLKFNYGIFQLEAGANIFKPICKVSDFLIQEVSQGYEAYHIFTFPEKKLDLSQFYLSIGLCMP